MAAFFALVCLKKQGLESGVVDPVAVQVCEQQQFHQMCVLFSRGCTTYIW